MFSNVLRTSWMARVSVPLGNIFDEVNPLEIHIKFADEWLMMADMPKVHGEELLHAFNHLSKQMSNALEKFLIDGQMVDKVKGGKIGKSGFIVGKDEV